MALHSSLEYEKALKDRPNKGGVAAIVAQRTHMEVFLSTTCEFGIVGHEFTKMGWGFVSLSSLCLISITPLLLYFLALHCLCLLSLVHILAYILRQIGC